MRKVNGRTTIVLALSLILSIIIFLQNFLYVQILYKNRGKLLGTVHFFRNTHVKNSSDFYN